MKKEQSISSFHSHLISHKAKQWKEKLVPRARGSDLSLGSTTCSSLAAPPVVTTGTQGMGHEARHPQHLENIIKILHMAKRRDPLGYWVSVAHISYQEVLRQNDCVTWRFHCAILKIRNVYLLKHPSRAPSQATLAALCSITVQMQRINEKDWFGKANSSSLISQREAGEWLDNVCITVE